MSDDLEQRLAAALDRRFGAGHRVEALARLSGGASRETWRFTATDRAGASRGMVLKRDPDPAAAPEQVVHLTLGVDRATECAALGAAGAAGVPVPAVVFLAEPADRIGTGFVTEQLAGETIARRILRDDAYAAARPRMAGQCGAIAARIHAVDPAAVPGLKRLDGADELKLYRRMLDDFGDPYPGFEYGLVWLADRRPADRPLTFVHGDFRNGNFIVDGDGIRAVLDWELAHQGDPMSDLGWLCIRSWRYGMTEHPVGGFGARADLFQAYEAAGGGPVDPDRVRYWEIFGTLRWGVMCLIMGYNHIRGAKRSIEMAEIGRRAAETEHDLLELID